MSSSGGELGGKGIVDVIRFTFPKNLRFNRQCIQFHGQLQYVVNRFKFKRYIPRKDIMHVLDAYEKVPYKQLRYPIVRHVLALRLVNNARTSRGSNSWMLSRALEVEHSIVRNWMKVNSTHQYVDREKFEREVMAEFHVAKGYHQLFVGLGISCIMFLILSIAFALAEHTIFFVYCILQGKTRREMREFFSESMKQQTGIYLPRGFEDKIPAPVIYNETDKHFYVQPVKMAYDPEKDTDNGEKKNVKYENGKSVIFIPFPLAAPDDCFSQIGQVVNTCDAVLLEGATEDALQAVPLHFFFPQVEPFFTGLGMSARHWRILHSGHQPPQFVAGDRAMGMLPTIKLTMTPLKSALFYKPSAGLDRESAKVGWARLKKFLVTDQLQELAQEEQKTGERRVTVSRPKRSICVPWNPLQIGSIEGSVLRRSGWEVCNNGREEHQLAPIRWVNPDSLGDKFCDYFGMPADDDTPLTWLEALRIMRDGLLYSEPPKTNPAVPYHI